MMAAAESQWGYVVLRQDVRRTIAAHLTGVGMRSKTVPANSAPSVGAMPAPAPLPCVRVGFPPLEPTKSHCSGIEQCNAIGC